MPLYLPDLASQINIIQQGAHFFASVFSALAQDLTTQSTGWVTLTSSSIVTTGINAVLINCSTSMTNSQSNQTIGLRLVINNVPKTAAGTQTVNKETPVGMSIMWKEPCTAGTQNVTLQWRVSAGTGQCRPVTQSDFESCLLLLEEVSA